MAPSLSNAAPAVNAFAAWQSGYTGAGIGVALIDSGVASHPDLNGGFLGLSRVVYNQSFVPGTSSPNDQYGHGTHVAGLIAGNGSSSTGSRYSRTFKGIAPQANIVNLRVLDQNGAGSDSAVIAAIARRDIQGAARLVPDEAVEAFAIAGTPQHCIRRLQDFIAAGIDEPVLGLLGTPQNCLLALDVMREFVG